MRERERECERERVSERERERVCERESMIPKQYRGHPLSVNRLLPTSNRTET